MKGKLTDPQELTRRKLRLVYSSRNQPPPTPQKTHTSEINDLGWDEAGPATTHGLTSSRSCSSPGSTANWILMMATCGAPSSSKYSSSHTGITSSSVAKSSALPTLATVPRYTVTHPCGYSSAMNSGMSGANGSVEPPSTAVGR